MVLQRNFRTMTNIFQSSNTTLMLTPQTQLIATENSLSSLCEEQNANNTTHATKKNLFMRKGEKKRGDRRTRNKFIKNHKHRNFSHMPTALHCWASLTMKTFLSIGATNNQNTFAVVPLPSVVISLTQNKLS